MEKVTKYDLKINDKHRIINASAENELRKLRKDIGMVIFSTFETWLKDEETKEVPYSTASYLLKRIFEDNVVVKLKYRLCMAGFHVCNDTISNEYSEILKLQAENEELKRMVKFHEGLRSTSKIEPID